MDVFEAIAKRHSYRGEFTDAPIPHEHLVHIVQAGIDAPSGCNGQTTHFIAINDPLLIQAIASIMDRPYIRTAKAIVACVCDKRPVKEGSDTTYYKEDAAAAVENMLLAITAIGYATVWLQGALAGDIAHHLAGLLAVPKNKELLIILPIGVPKTQERPNTKKSFEKRVSFNTYGNENSI